MGKLSSEKYYNFTNIHLFVLIFRNMYKRMAKRTARKSVSSTTPRFLATAPPAASILVPAPPSPVLHHQVVTRTEFIPQRPILHRMGYFGAPPRCVSNAGSAEPAIYPLGVLYQLSGVGFGLRSTVNYYDEDLVDVRGSRATFLPHLRYWGYYVLEVGVDDTPWYYTESVHGRMCYYRLTSSEVELMNVRLDERHEVSHHIAEYRAGYRARCDDTTSEEDGSH